MHQLMPKHHFKDYLRLFKEAFYIFKENHPVKFASAIAYFALFALPCIFLILSYVLGLLYDTTEVMQELEEQLEDVVGADGAEILVIITQNYGEHAEESVWTILMYIVIVFWLSTQLFRLFQNSLNDLWLIKPRYEKVWQRIWVERGLTFVFVLATGLLFFASLGVERLLQFTLTTVMGDPELNSNVTNTLVDSFTVVLVFLWFSILYKELPAAKIKWEPTFVGAAVTTVLFFAGFWLLWNFVVLRDLEELYATVAPIIRVALWIFYSSLVFLFGASFTKAYANLKDKNIMPAPYAYKYKVVKDTANN
ncbi:YihY/virulence factor BrkB family protein [Pontibacter diazotrophicus]|uniref:YihY/virulence factor BrkB family protein n=1 Tax=Pontibacter diazotrophicus TaxID=1400979 RepID=A0A3D8LC20_9BACT|nr:YihY/virulence factor BrkB family protein [Pontibacter diazotrophicus]RDV14502.1 YihY/virulence factor BrkB family protein [Pontibacter diazotrophicus]